MHIVNIRNITDNVFTINNFTTAKAKLYEMEVLIIKKETANPQ